MKIRRILCLVLALCLLNMGGALAASKPKAIYHGIITKRYGTSFTNVYKTMSKSGVVLKTMKPGAAIEITEVYPNWVAILVGEKSVGYVLRNRIDVTEAVDPKKTPPYPVMVHGYYALIDRDIDVKSAKKASSETLTTLSAGARIALIGVESGWAKLVYHRQYGYIDCRQLTEIYPVAADIESADGSMPLAVFTSYFNDNPDRINNLNVACKCISKVMKPGEKMNFNQTVGPFSAEHGYMPAPVLKDGQTTQSYGGGSCQVSSTLWDTLMQMPGITVLMRKPHGNNAAAYLPHGMDASSGATNLNLIFRNDYNFSIRIDASTHDHALFVAVYKEI